MARYRRHKLTAGRILENRATIITAPDNKMHDLNEPGSAIWQHCENPRSIEELVACLLEIYSGEVEAEQLKLDVSAAVKDFVLRGILEEIND